MNLYRSKRRERSRALSLLCFLCSLLCISAADVQPPADHRIEWANWTGALGGGRVPSTNGWTHYTTLTWPTHGRNDIITAINAAPAYGIIRLAGTGWRIDAAGADVVIPINRSSVRLIGSGAWNKQLEITNAGVQSVFGINSGAWEVPPGNRVDWTDGYNKGDSNITLSSVASLAVGKLILLTQTTDNEDVQGIGDEGACDYCAGMLYTHANATNWTQQEHKIVTAINGSIVTVYPPLLATNWAGSKSPQAVYFNTATVTNVWIEDLGWTNRDNSIKYLIEGMNVMNYGFKKCWSQRGLLAHFKTLHTAFWTIEGCLFEQTFMSSTESYGIAPYNTSHGLVMDSGFNSITGPWKATSASGCAFVYNFVTNQPYANPSGSSSGTNWLIGSASAHGSFTFLTLTEGNMLNAIYNDFIHGSQGWNIAFRNRIFGHQFDRTANTFALTLEYKNRYNHAYGNVLGWQGFHSTTESLYNASVPSPDRSVYLIGYRDTDHLTTDGDTATVNTFSRSHNWDNVTTTNNKTMFNSGYGANDTVPASLLYSDRPAWFGNLPWPPLGYEYPERSTNHAVIRIPAWYRYNLAVDAANMELFFTDLVADRAVVVAIPTAETRIDPRKFIP